MARVKGWPWRRGRLGRLPSLSNLGISAQSAAVSGIVVLLAFACAGAVLDVILYRSLMIDVDDATAGRVHSIAEALQSKSTDALHRELLTINHHVVAIQLISPDGKVVERAGSAPDTPLVPTTDFDLRLRRGMPGGLHLRGQADALHPP